MSSPTVEALRAELRAELVRIEPQIRGMEDLLKVSLSREVLDPIQVELTDRKRRRDLDQAVLIALATLDSEGYPDLPKGELSQAATDELIGQMADFVAATAEFTEALQASAATVTLGQPTDNP